MPKNIAKIIEEYKQTTKHDELMQKLRDREWYVLRSMLGYSWAIFLFLLGGREVGKSYSVTDFYVEQYIKKGIPFYWLRLSEKSAMKLLTNNAEKLVDPDLRRKYNLDLVTNGNNVYNVRRRSKPDKKGKTKILEKELMASVYSIATFYNDKGSGLFDKDFLKSRPNMFYNICMDEMNREKSEKNSFDIVYSFTNQLENLVRSTKGRVRVICIGNTLEEASDLLCAFNFIPEQFGRYKLVKNKKLLMEYLYKLERVKNDKERAELDREYKDVDFGKRAVIEYIEPTEAYSNRRKGTIADILMPTASTFTNMIKTDDTLVYKGRCKTPQHVIKFTKDTKDWFTLWENGVISQWNKESKPAIAMRPYLDEVFDMKIMTAIMQKFDYRSFKYKDLITFKMFQKNMNLLKPRGN